MAAEVIEVPFDRLSSVPDGTQVEISMKYLLLRYFGGCVALGWRRGLTEDVLFAWKREDWTWRCDRPLRSYPAEVRPCVRLGLIDSAQLFDGRSIEVQFDEHGRVWTSNFYTPSSVPGWAVANPQALLERACAFCDTLAELMHYRKDGRDVLVRYYRDIRFFSSTSHHFAALLDDRSLSDLSATIARLLELSAPEFNRAWGNRVLRSVGYRLKQAGAVIPSPENGGSRATVVAEIALLMSDAKRYIGNCARASSADLRALQPRTLTSLQTGVPH